MANQINVVDSIIDFYTDIKSIIDKKGIYFYIVNSFDSGWNIKLIDDIQTLITSIDNGYHSFYLTSEPCEKYDLKYFFTDEYCIHVIEGLGGRYNDFEVENISLRIVSKTPDKKIKSFLNHIKRFLGENSEYGIGVGPGKSSFYKNTFFKKMIVKDKTLWFDFKRKVQPITLIVNSY